MSQCQINDSLDLCCQLTGQFPCLLLLTTGTEPQPKLQSLC